MSDFTSYISYISSTPFFTRSLQKIDKIDGDTKTTPLISRSLARAFPSKERRFLLAKPTYEIFVFRILRSRLE
jgi:hypothetical protein